jgi:hypothetical protein
MVQTPFTFLELISARAEPDLPTTWSVMLTNLVEPTNLFIVVQNAQSNFLHVAYASLNGRRFPYGLILNDSETA